MSGGDACLSIFEYVYATGALVFPPEARVLEIGCAEADWMTPMLATRPDLQITGIDWRGVDRPRAVIQGDVLTHKFQAASFDAVVGISSIEHIGLGHYSGDPLDDDGDQHCMERVAQWLKPGGWVYADVPYGPAYLVSGTAYRVYDDDALRRRLLVPGLSLVDRWFSIGTGLVASATDLPADRFAYVALLARKES